MPLGSLIYKIPCHHQYHCECLKKWLLVSSSCPTCRLHIKWMKKQSIRYWMFILIYIPYEWDYSRSAVQGCHLPINKYHFSYRSSNNLKISPISSCIFQDNAYIKTKLVELSICMSSFYYFKLIFMHSEGLYEKL
jgi:hypothetical protein